MNRKPRWPPFIQPLLSLFVSSLLLVPMSSSAACTSSYLAPGFCDQNGDLIADPPVDKTQWLDPDPVVVSDVPTADTAQRAERATDFLKYLEKTVGRKFTLFLPKDNAELLEEFRANRVHLANLNTGMVEMAVRCYGYTPIAQVIDSKGDAAGYRMELIVPAGSSVKSVADLRGKRITFVDESSNSGYKAPRAVLAKEFKLAANLDYQYNFSGKHENSIAGVASGLYEIAATASDVKAKLVQDGLIETKAIRVIYESPSFPHSPFGVSHRMNPTLKARLRDAFVSYAGRNDVLYNGSRFRKADFKTDWAFMRKISPDSDQPPVCK